MTVTLWHYLALSALLLAAGVLTMALRRNAIGIFMGIELIVTAAGLNFVAFNAYLPATGDSPRLEGQVFALFLMLVTAVQTALAVAVFIQVRGQSRTLDVEKLERSPAAAPAADGPAV